jgi:protein tyrosine/serine phosphatase
MNEHNELIKKLNNILTESADKESVIKLLRLSNYSKSESIEILKKALGISYYEAQDIIHNSQTWSDVKEFDSKLINDFFDILEELGSMESEQT